MCPGLHALSTHDPFHTANSDGGGRNCPGGRSKRLRTGPYDALLYARLVLHLEEFPVDVFLLVHDEYITPFEVQNTLSALRSETLAFFSRAPGLDSRSVPFRRPPRGNIHPQPVVASLGFAPPDSPPHC